MLWAVVGIIILVWLGGIVLNLAGSFIHLLLVIAIVVGLFNLVSGSRGRAAI